MQAITPVVGISKIITPYDNIIVGFRGVLQKQNDTCCAEALDALEKIALLRKEIVVLSNTPLRAFQIAALLRDCKFDLHTLKAIITAGDIAHYRLKNQTKFARRFYNLGGDADKAVFAGLNYKKVQKIEQAGFIFIGDMNPLKKDTDDYIPDLQDAVAIGLPFVCVGTDVSTYENGDTCLSVGAIAEQYAALGGKIITIGKPNADILDYTKEAFTDSNKKTLYIGDSFMTDMHSATLIKADTLFVSKGIHKKTLGEGYIPDIQKVRTLALNFNVYPNYVISDLRY